MHINIVQFSMCKASCTQTHILLSMHVLNYLLELSKIGIVLIFIFYTTFYFPNLVNILQNFLCL